MSKHVPNECKLNWTGINFPATVTDAVKFERINPDVSICVYKFDGKFPRPIFLSNRMNLDDIHKYREVDLLLVIDQKDQDDNTAVDPAGQHYVWIKNFDTFCYRYSKHEHKKYPAEDV